MVWLQCLTTLVNQQYLLEFQNRLPRFLICHRPVRENQERFLLFYFSKDIEYLLPLPLKPYEIVIAKFNTILVTEYITVFAFLLVPFIIYGIVTSASLLFYLYGALVLLVFPILPALISSIIVMLVMSITGIIKNKDK